MAINVSENCSTDTIRYQSITGINLAIFEWQAILTTISLALIILITIFENMFVMISVFTYIPLRISHNFLLVSLAVGDFVLAAFVMPLSVAYIILGKWRLGFTMCKVWLTFNTLSCPASILNTCAIALDRYWAVKYPINYAQQRSLNRVIGMISGVWVLSAIIATPPLFGWNDWPDEEEFNKKFECPLNSQQGYVVYSLIGSFGIPFFIMTIVNFETIVANRRRESAKALQMNMLLRQNNAPNQRAVVVPKEQIQPPSDQYSVSCTVEKVPSCQNKENKLNNKTLKRKVTEEKMKYLAPMLVLDESATETNDSAVCSKPYTLPNHLNDNHTINMESPSSCTRDGFPTNVDVVVAKFIKEKRRISVSRERRASRSLFMVIIVFLVCWCPFFIFYVINAFCSSCYLSPVWVQFITWLGYFYSTLNPLIYTIFNRDFRRAFKKMLCMKT